MKWCSKYNMWCDEVEDNLDDEQDCDMDCKNCDWMEVVK